MSRITPVATPSPPLRSVSRHQISPQLKSNFPDLSIHRKSSELICESPTDFQLLATKSTDAYQDEEPFPANCKKDFFTFSKIPKLKHGKNKRKRKFYQASKKNGIHKWVVVFFCLLVYALSEFRSIHYFSSCFVRIMCFC